VLTNIRKFLKQPSIKRWVLKFLVVAFAFSSLVFLSILVFNIYYWGRIYKGVYIANTYVGGLVPEQAKNLLYNNLNGLNKTTLSYDNQNYDIYLDDIDFSYDIDKSVSSAYKLYRSDNIFYDQTNSIKSLTKNVVLALEYKLDEQKLKDNLSIIAGQITTNDPVFPSLNLVNGEVVIKRGVPGEEVDYQKLISLIRKNLAIQQKNILPIPVTKIDKTLDDEGVKKLEAKAMSLVNKALSLKFEYYNLGLIDKDLVPLILLNNDQQDNLDVLITRIEKEVNREPQNSVFVFQERVLEFSPSKDGISVDKENLRKLMLQNIEELADGDEKSFEIEIPVIRTPAEITTAEVNNLGIKQLIGSGSSKFVGSIPSRIHNIGLASSKINGTLVAPGETFSFNQRLGDVSAFTGYKQAYIIKDGRTVLGDGGGVCQVSTTLFRAVLNAGLPVVERKAHAYRVSYYEQDSAPGLDATVYDPLTDFKFLNDTEGHILIQTIFDPKKFSLIFEIYGTSDGRKSQITKPIVSAVISPPEDLYTDDPTLPTGTIKQVDFKAWGAKVSFNYSVERNGEIIYEKTFISNFRPWQAKFLRGTGPAN